MDVIINDNGQALSVEFTVEGFTLIHHSGVRPVGSFCALQAQWGLYYPLCTPRSQTRFAAVRLHGA